jgi:hypothetical protein
MASPADAFKSPPSQPIVLIAATSKIRFKLLNVIGKALME